MSSDEKTKSIDAKNQSFGLSAFFTLERYGYLYMNSSSGSGNCKYKRILLKLSGEALSTGGGILNYAFIKQICANVKKCLDMGVQVSIVVGAGNIWRGRMGPEMDRTRADHMGMLATTINALAIADVLEHAGIVTRVMTAIAMHELAEPYIRNRAVHHLEKGMVVIYGCGIGRPFFSTDTSAVQYAIETDCDIVLMAKNIDAVYTADPKVDSSAKRLASISHMYLLENQLTVIDSTATSLAKDNNMPIMIFGLDDPDNIFRAVSGEEMGTVVNG